MSTPFKKKKLIFKNKILKNFYTTPIMSSALTACFNDIVNCHTTEFPRLTEEWVTLDCAIKLAPENPAININSLILQKKLVTTEMKIINSLRMKNVVQYTALLDKYKSISSDLMLDCEEHSDNIISHNLFEEDPRSVNEQAYIELCNYLLARVKLHDKTLQTLIQYNEARKKMVVS
jgi:hypothetical protein